MDAGDLMARLADRGLRLDLDPDSGGVYASVRDERTGDFEGTVIPEGILRDEQARSASVAETLRFLIDSVSERRGTEA